MAEQSDLIPIEERWRSDEHLLVAPQQKKGDKND